MKAKNTVNKVREENRPPHYGIYPSPPIPLPSPGANKSRRNLVTIVLLVTVPCVAGMTDDMRLWPSS